MLNKINLYQMDANINYMLTRGGLEKPYKIRKYEELRNKSIDKISSNR